MDTYIHATDIHLVGFLGPTLSWGEVDSAKTFSPQSLPGYPILRALASCFVNKVVGEMQMNEGKGTSSEKGKARQTVTGRMYYVL